MTTDLTTADPALVAVPMMDADEARGVITQIRAHLDGARRLLLDLEEREGWRALGYDSWRACVVAEFGQSQATLYRQLEAAKIERDVRGDSQVEKSIPTAQLQVVKDLPAEQRRAAFDRADALAGDEPRTAAHVRQAVQEITPPPAEPDAPFWQALSPHHPTAHLWRPNGHGGYVAACGIIHSKAPDGDTERGHCSSCVRATWSAINRPDGSPALASAEAAEPPPTPSLDELLGRLDALGYTRVGAPRQRGSTIYHSFLEQATGEELELAEGELPYWLTQLDEREVARAARRAEYEDAQARYARLGWRLTREGQQFALYDPRGELYARTADLAPQLRTLATFEAGVAKRAAAQAASAAPDFPRLPPDYADAQKRARAIGLNLDMDMHGKFSCLNERNSGVMHYDWPSILKHLDYAEQAHAELEAERAKRQQAATQPAPLSCTSCGQPITNGHFGGQCGPCYRGEATAPASLHRRIWPLVCEVERFGRADDRAGVIRKALAIARSAAGDDLAALAEQLDDAEYEALARLLRPDEVPT